jgi:hypothetical protein
VLKWIGGCTAVLSLVFGLRQLTLLISEARDKRHQVTELIAMGQLQRDARDYGSAWKSLSKAAELGPKEPAVRTAQEDLAMTWLDDIRGDQSSMPFRATVDMVVPVLSRGVLTAEGPRKADLLAHLGWADFLRWRDGDHSLDPAGRYRQALAADSGNVYAHTMLAHWKLWNGGDLEESNRHFATALRSGRERPYVRRLQLAALANRRDPVADLDMVRVANDMRKDGESMTPDGRDRLWDVYYGRFVSAPDESASEQPTNAAPPGELLATYRWLFDTSDYVESKGLLYEYLLARLQDAAGQNAEALASYRAVRPKAQTNGMGHIRDAVDSAIVRLTKRR